MLDRLLPRSIDNGYRGRKAALWLFGGLLVLKSGMGVNSMVNARTVASSADGIPLDTFGAAGAQAVVAFFAVWGLSQAVMALLGWVTLARYRAMVPMVLALILIEHVSRKLIFLATPVATAGAAPGGWINLALLAVEIAALVLSLV